MRSKGVFGSLLAAAAQTPLSRTLRRMGDDYFPRAKPPKATKRYPQMITSTYIQIKEHNADCNTRQVRRYKARQENKAFLATHKR